MKAKKTSINKLQDLMRIPWDGPESLDVTGRALYTEYVSDQQFDFIVAPKPDTRKLIVFFSGDAKRSMFDPPAFQRWSWASKFPATCVFVSDPALHNDSNLGLAWYAGWKQGDYLKHIWELVEEIRIRFGVPGDQLFSYGSSGGGFAALRSSQYVPGLNVVAVNPQTDLWKYPKKWTNRLARAEYGVPSLQMVDSSEHYKFTCLDSATLNRATRILLAQNKQDQEHLDHHCQPFLELADATGGTSKINVQIFSDASGHAGAENEDVFSNIQVFLRV